MTTKVRNSDPTQPLGGALERVMTPEQIAVARHALGLTGRNRESFRNSFVTGAGCENHALWLAMVDAGDAIKRDGENLPFGGDDLFYLTLQGAMKVLRPDERFENGLWARNPRAPKYNR